MAIEIKHKFTSAKADSADATLIRPSNWNDAHDIIMGTGRLVGRYTPGDGPAQEVSIGSNLTMDGSGLDLSDAFMSSFNAKAPLASPTFTGEPKAPTVAATDDSAKLATTAFVHDLFPPGIILPYAADVTPAGWLQCDGALVSRTTYAALFAVIGTIYGAGNGSTTFKLPDLRGEFIRGWDDGRGVDVDRVLGSAQAQQLEQHYHGVRWNQQVNTSTGGSSNRVTALEEDGSFTVRSGVVVNDTGGTSLAGAETRPRNIALVYLIKL